MLLGATAGRAPGSITPAFHATVNLNPDPATAQAELAAYTRAYYDRPLDEMHRFQGFFGGSPADCLRWLRSYTDAAARHLALRIGSLDIERQLRLLTEAVLPGLRA